MWNNKIQKYIPSFLHRLRRHIEFLFQFFIIVESRQRGAQYEVYSARHTRSRHMNKKNTFYNVNKSTHQFFFHPSIEYIKASLCVQVGGGGSKNVYIPIHKAGQVSKYRQAFRCVLYDNINFVCSSSIRECVYVCVRVPKHTYSHACTHTHSAEESIYIFYV